MGFAFGTRRKGQLRLLLLLRYFAKRHACFTVCLASQLLPDPSPSHPWHLSEDRSSEAPSLPAGGTNFGSTVVSIGMRGMLSRKDCAQGRNSLSSRCSRKHSSLEFHAWSSTMVSTDNKKSHAKVSRPCARNMRRCDNSSPAKAAPAIQQETTCSAAMYETWTRVNIQKVARQNGFDQRQASGCYKVVCIGSDVDVCNFICNI